MPFLLPYNLFIKYKLVFLPKIPILNAFKLFYYWRFSYVIKINWIGATIKKKREKDYGVQTRAVLWQMCQVSNDCALQCDQVFKKDFKYSGKVWLRAPVQRVLQPWIQIMLGAAL